MEGFKQKGLYDALVNFNSNTIPVDGKLIISVNEARKLLGREAKMLSDDQVIDTIITLHRIAKNNLYKKVPKNA